MKIAVCAPTFGKGPEFEHPTPIHVIAQELGSMTPFTGGCSPHDRSRGMIQARAMQTEAEAFLWIDDDIRATVEQTRRLVQSFRELKAPQTVTGVYVCRHHAEQGLVAFNFNAIPPAEGEPDIEISFGPNGDVFPITSHGFGFCIVSRSCLEMMSAPKCEYEPGIPAKAWWLPEVVEGQHIGEDRSFTYRVWRQYHNLAFGRKVINPNELPMWVDSRVCVEHAGWRVGS